MRTYSVNNSPSWVRGGEILSRLCFNRPYLKGHECMKCTENELLIAFTNSQIYPAPSASCGGNPYHCAAIGVNPAQQANMDTWANTGPAYHLPSTPSYRKAASLIASCLYRQCCSYAIKPTWPTSKPKLPWGRSIDQEEEDLDDLEDRRGPFKLKQAAEIFEYMDPKSEKSPKTFKGTFDQFNAQVLKRNGVNSDGQTIVKG